MTRFVAMIVLAVMVAWLGGCNGMIKHVMVQAPNHGRRIEPIEGEPGLYFQALGVREQFYVTVGPPEARLRCLVREPSEGAVPGTVPRAVPGAELRGTLLVLHGWRNSAGPMVAITGRLADAGYRLVYVDLRGHGRSSGDYISYGAVESRDLSQVIDELERRGLSDGRLGVWGVSMGAATAIQLAGHDERIDAVVAIAPYRSMREIVPVVVRRGLPVAGWMMSDEHIASLVDEAAGEAGFDADEADTLAAIEATSAPVLIAHGTIDFVVPYTHGQSLAATAPEHTQFIQLDATGHVLAGADLSGRVTRASIDWFGRYLVAETP